MKLPPLFASGVAVFVLALTGCSGVSAEDLQTVLTPAGPAVETPRDFGNVFTDGVGVKRASIDPASVKIADCKGVKEDYTNIGEDFVYSATVKLKATNTTPLTGVLSVTVQYSNSAGEVITPQGLPGAENIRPGQTANLSDMTMVEEDALPDLKLGCEVIKAEVYVPTE